MSRRLIVVGGGTGFIGQHLEYLLRLKGYDVNIITRSPKKKHHLSWKDVETIGLPNGTHAVVNLAGQNILDWKHPWTSSFKNLVWDSRINTTKLLVKSISSAPQVDSLTTISGVSVYRADNEIHSEKSSVETFDFLSEMCMELETVCRIPPEVKCRNIIIRSGVVLGLGGGMVQQLYLPFSLGLGGPMGSGSQLLPWIHVSDLTNLMIHLLEIPEASGIFNGVAPTETTNKEFAQAFGSALRRPAIIPMPEIILNLMFQERAKMITTGPRVNPERTLNSGFKFSYPDIGTAMKDIVENRRDYDKR